MTDTTANLLKAGRLDEAGICTGQVAAPTYKLQQALKLLKRINLKTVVFNLKYFPLKTAVKFPVLVSKNVFLYKTNGRIIISAPIKTGMIQIGYGKVGVSDFKRVRAVWEVDGEIVFNGKADIMHGSKISVAKQAQLVIGNNVFINTETAIVAGKRIKIGDNSSISWETLIMDTDFHAIADRYGNVINAPREVVIKNNVWVCCRCTILKGAILPAGSVIAANSLVTGPLKGDNSIFGGNPAKLLKSDISWKL